MLARFFWKGAGMTSSKRWLAAPAAVLCIAGVAACGSSSSSSSSSTTSSSTTNATPSAAANPAVAKLVPAAIKSKGTLSVASDASYAPNEFMGPDGHTVIGMDADLMKAVAAEMGLKANIVNVPFASILTGLAAGKYDVGASSFTDTKAREKTVDFVDYFTAGESFFTKASGGVSISTIADICGKTVAVETGTTEKDDATTQSGKCTKAGKPAVKVVVFPDQNGANLALSSGRAQLDFADSPVAAYQVQKSGGQFKLVGASFANAPYGLAVAKNSGLAKPILAAVQALLKSGSYSSILAHWGLQGGAITPAGVKINGATS
jgi:polar amino acid transport system substrate-binding protein